MKTNIKQIYINKIKKIERLGFKIFKKMDEDYKFQINKYMVQL